MLIVISFSGCTCKSDVVYVPQKCVVASTAEPVIDNALCGAGNYKCVQDKLLLNYEAMKVYAKELVAKQEKCK